MALSPAGISVVIAARNEAARLPLLLADLATAPQLVTEVLVVDGASGDGTPRLAALAGARVLACSPGRGQQLALGVSSSSGGWLLLLTHEPCDAAVARASTVVFKTTQLPFEPDGCRAYQRDFCSNTGIANLLAHR